MTKRRLTAALLVLLVALLAFTNTAAAAPRPLTAPVTVPADSCGSFTFSGLGECLKDGAGLVTDPVGTAIGAAGDVLGKFSPSNIIEEWAKSVATSSASLLDEVGKLALKVSTPDFTASWWLSQYSVSLALGLVVLAFVLLVVTARLGRDGPEGVMLLRSAGWRAWMYLPAMALVPALMAGIEDVTSGWAKGYSDEAAGQAGGAIGKYTDALGHLSGPAGIIGGAFAMLLLAAITVISALIMIVELLAAGYGTYLSALIVPFAAAVAVYPPARQMLSKLLGLLLGLLLVPVVVFASYWLLWSAANGVGADSSPAGVFTTMLYVAVFAACTAASPMALRVVLPVITSAGAAHAELSGRVRDSASRIGNTVRGGANSLGSMQSRRSGAGGWSPMSATGTGGGGGASAGAGSGAAAGGGPAGAALVGAQAVGSAVTAPRRAAGLELVGANALGPGASTGTGGSAVGERSASGAASSAPAGHGGAAGQASLGGGETTRVSGTTAGSGAARLGAAPRRGPDQAGEASPSAGGATSSRSGSTRPLPTVAGPGSSGTRPGPRPTPRTQSSTSSTLGAAPRPAPARAPRSEQGGGPSARPVRLPPARGAEGDG